MERFLSFYSLFKIVLVILVPLPFYIRFKITLSRSKKFLLRFFFLKGIALNLCISLEKIDIFIILSFLIHEQGFPGGSVVKNLSANAGDASLIPGSGRCPGEGNGNPLQYSCLGNPMDGGAWWATVCGVTKSLLWIGN